MKSTNKLGAGGAPGRGSFLAADPPAEGAALTEAAHATEARGRTALMERQALNGSSNGNSR
jgi:ubiquinol-cytochrome c reductase cytochrome b subunit